MITIGFDGDSILAPGVQKLNEAVENISNVSKNFLTGERTEFRLDNVKNFNNFLDLKPKKKKPKKDKAEWKDNWVFWDRQKVIPKELKQINDFLDRMRVPRYFYMTLADWTLYEMIQFPLSVVGGAAIADSIVSLPAFTAFSPVSAIAGSLTFFGSFLLVFLPSFALGLVATAIGAISFAFTTSLASNALNGSFVASIANWFVTTTIPFWVALIGIFFVTFLLSTMLGLLTALFSWFATFWGLEALFVTASLNIVLLIVPAAYVNVVMQILDRVNHPQMSKRNKKSPRSKKSSKNKNKPKKRPKKKVIDLNTQKISSNKKVIIDLVELRGEEKSNTINLLTKYELLSNIPMIKLDATQKFISLKDINKVDGEEDDSLICTPNGTGATCEPASNSDQVENQDFVDNSQQTNPGTPTVVEPEKESQDSKAKDHSKQKPRVKPKKVWPNSKTKLEDRVEYYILMNRRTGKQNQMWNLIDDLYGTKKSPGVLRPILDTIASTVD